MPLGTTIEDIKEIELENGKKFPVISSVFLSETFCVCEIGRDNAKRRRAVEPIEDDEGG